MEVNIMGGLRIRDIKNIISNDTYIIIKDKEYLFGGFIDKLRIELMCRYILKIRTIDNCLVLEVL